MRGAIGKAVGLVARGYGIELWLDFEGLLRRRPFDFGDTGATVAVIDPRGELVFRASGTLGPTERARLIEAMGATLGRALTDVLAARRADAA